MCNPFGQEAIRAHRMFRVLADRLVRAGVSVLRFDPFGTGDSEGDDSDCDLDGWRSDVLAAHEQLIHRSSAQHICWMGVRLGATAAVQAAHDAGAAVQRLVLWDPIVDGVAYLDMLRAKHVDTLETIFSFPDPAWRRLAAADPSAYIDEALGFALSPALREQLLGVRADTLPIPATTETHVIADPGDARVRHWLEARRAPPVSFIPLEYGFDWTAGDAMNTALVPARALKILLASLGEGRP
jgi:pimeloyl-ACP methyl ester carboxylesterase